MLHKEKNISVIGTIILLLVILNVLILKVAFIQNENWYWALVITLPLLLIAIVNVRQTKHAVLHNYPVTDHLHYFFESIRPEPKQYLSETGLNGKPIIAQEDFEMLSAYVKGLKPVKAFDKKNAALLNEELKKATLIKKDELPEDVVRLNSRVVVKEGNKDTLIDLILVVPERADIKEKRISVFAPNGTALIGFREGAKVKWNVPSGSTTFTIMKVYNPKK